MGEEQIFTNAFDFLDIVIAISKHGRKAFSKLPDPVIVSDELPKVKDLVKSYDKTNFLKIFTRQRIDNEIKSCCKEIVTDMQTFEKALNFANAKTIDNLINKYKNLPRVTEMQAEFIFEKKIDTNVLIKLNTLDQFLFTDYAKNIQLADTLNLTKDIKPLNIIYINCIKTSRENMIRQVEDKIFSSKHKANMQGTPLDKNMLKSLTDKLKTHQAIIKKIENKTIKKEEVLPPKVLQIVYKAQSSEKLKSATKKLKQQHIVESKQKLGIL
jgi:hypothetical protein